MKKKSNLRILEICVQAVFVGLWFLTTYFFYHFYNDAILLGEGESSIVIKLMMIIRYRESELSKLLIVIFILLTLNLMYLMLLKFKKEKGGALKEFDSKLLKIGTILFLLFLVVISFNVVGLVIVPLFLLAMTITYVSYLIGMYRFGDEIFAKKELLGVHGPFETQVELNEYISEKKQENKLKGISNKMFIEENQYFVEYYSDSGEEKK